LSHLRSNWNALRPAEKFAAEALFVAIVLELLSWAVFPFNGYDSFSHIFWIGEWHSMWQAGIYYPRWLPDSFHGFGAPSFYYYPPLTFFLSSALYTVLPSLSPDTIGKILGILAFGFSILSMWLYLRWRSASVSQTIKSNIGILLGALLYGFAPYRIFNYSTRGALPEHIAFCMVPFAFWGADLILQRRQANDLRHAMGMLICSFALLVLANLPAATVTAIGVVLYVAVVGRNAKVRDLGWLSFAGITSLLLAAFYVLPVAALFGNVQMERLWRPVSLVQSSPFLAVFSGEALTINSYTFVMLAGGCLLLYGWLRNKLAPKPHFWLVVFIIAAQLPVLTQYLYRHVPPFTIVQLASRFSILLIIVVAIAWQEELQVRDFGKRVPMTSAIVIFWSICTIGLVGLQLADVHIHKHGPLPIGDAPEYATRWAKPYDKYGDSLSTPFVNDSQTVVWASNDSVSLISSVRKPYSDTIGYRSNVPARTLIRRSYWPTWKAAVDGNPVATAPDSLGRLTLTVPEGKHQLVLNLETSRAAETGSWISVSSLVTLIALWIFYPKSRDSKSRNRPRNPL
jgi:hypothetical protein